MAPATTPSAPGGSVIASRTEVDSFKPTLEDYGRCARTFGGIGFRTGWLWAAVTTEDGQRYALLREHQAGGTYLYYALEISSDVWVDPKIRYANIPGFDSLYTGPLNYERQGDTYAISSVNPLYAQVTIALSPGRLTWKEGNWIDLVMEPLGVAMRYRCPGPPDDFGYTSQICRISGTLQGKPISGYGGYDRHYGEHGIEWRQCKGFTSLEQMWWVWAGEHEDGRQEHGTAVIGPGDFRVGFFHRDGEQPIAVNKLETEIHWQERNGRRLPLDATLRFAGHTFHYHANGNVTVPGMDLSINWMHGEMLEKGKPRPKQVFSWLEFFKHLAQPTG